MKFENYDMNDGDFELTELFIDTGVIELEELDFSDITPENEDFSASMEAAEDEVSLFVSEEDAEELEFLDFEDEAEQEVPKEIITKKVNTRNRRFAIPFLEKFRDASQTTRLLDAAIILSGVIVICCGFIFGTRYVQAKNMPRQEVTQSDFAAYQNQFSGVAMIGADKVQAVANERIRQEEEEAERLRLEKEAEEKRLQEEEEKAKEGSREIVMSLSSVQSDLKIKFLLKEEQTMVAGVPFKVEVKDPAGKTSTYADDDQDGIIYKDKIAAGEYKVKMVAFDEKALEKNKKLKEYKLPTEEQKVTVTDQLAYKKIDIAGEVKKESEINVAQEDTAKKDTVVESVAQDTVAWVESTKTEVDDAGFAEDETTYEKVEKNDIPNPFSTASAGLYTQYRQLAVRKGAVLKAETDADSSAETTSETTPSEETTSENEPGTPSGEEGGDGANAGNSGEPSTPADPPTSEEQPKPEDKPATSEEQPKPEDKPATSEEQPKPEVKLSIAYGETVLMEGQEAVGLPAVTVTGAKETGVNWSVTKGSDVVAIADGKFKPIKAGSAVLTAISKADPSKSVSLKVTVNPAKREITIQSVESTMTIRVGKTGKINPSVTGTDDTAVSFVSDNAAIATVSDDGTISGIAEGTANITVTAHADANVKKIVQVIVKNAVDETARLKDKEGNPLYIRKPDGGYVEAYVSDYEHYDTFYRRVSTTKQYRYTGWQTIDGKTYYFNADGSYVTGEQTIQGAKHTFGADGALVTANSTMGIDVSTWNGNIDWAAVKNSGVSYAIIRCGYRGSSIGKIIEDSKFRANIQGARNAGIKVGVYFFSQAVTEVEAVEEATYVLNAISGYGVSLPVFLDVESSGGRGDHIGIDQRTKNIQAFCKTISAYGYSAGVYANTTWFNQMINAPALTNYHIWLAQYSAAPTYTRTRYDIWQYSSTGRVSGISGNVDMNISYRAY